MLGHTARTLLAAATLAAAPLVAPAPASAAVTARYATTPIAGDRLDGTASAVVQVGGVTYVGGSFSRVRDQRGTTVATRVNVAAFTTATGKLITAFRADTDARVTSLASDGTRLFIGGTFTRVNGTARNRLAAVSLTTGAVASWRADADGYVYALAARGGRLYVGGSFTHLGSSSRSRFGVVSASTGALASTAPSFGGTVSSVAVSAGGSRLLVGGSFTTVNGRSRSRAVLLDSSTGTAISVQPNPVDGPASAAAFSDDGSLVFLSQSGAGNCGSAYRLSDGSRRWRQICDGDGQAIDQYGGLVYTGFHEGCAGDTAVRLTANDAITGARASWRPTFDRFWGVYSIDAASGALVVAGDFTRVSGVAVQGFAIFPRTA